MTKEFYAWLLQMPVGQFDPYTEVTVSYRSHHVTFRLQAYGSRPYLHVRVTDCGGTAFDPLELDECSRWIENEITLNETPPETDRAETETVLGSGRRRSQATPNDHQTPRERREVV